MLVQQRMFARVLASVATRYVVELGPHWLKNEVKKYRAWGCEVWRGKGVGFRV